uniref:Uncharacterized protein n=1 Tax=Anopheles culicifacies TaxID=139723 RepID=A0A182M3C2_9DIPT
MATWSFGSRGSPIDDVNRAKGQRPPILLYLVVRLIVPKSGVWGTLLLPPPPLLFGTLPDRPFIASIACVDEAAIGCPAGSRLQWLPLLRLLTVEPPYDEPMPPPEL